MKFIDSSADLASAFVGSYDWALVALSIFVAALGSFGALELSDRVKAAKGYISKSAWLATGAVAMGSSIWCMHFIAMLAFNLPKAVVYDPLITLVSTIPAIAASGVALYVISRERLKTAQLAIGGTFMGAGIGAMHYSGMMAMRMDAVMRYDPVLFTTSIFVAVLLATLALYVKFLTDEWTSERYSHWKRFASAWLMGLAIAGMHYTAMSGVYFFPTDASGAEIIGLYPRYLAVLAGLATVGLIGFSNIASAVGRRLEMALLLEKEVVERRQADTALKESESRFKDVAEVASDWIWELDADLRFSFISDRLYEKFAIAREDIIGKTREEFAGPGMLDDPWHQHLDDLANHRPFRNFQYEITLLDGSIRHIQISGKPVFDADGAFIGYRGTGTDETTEVEARKTLERSERQFRNLIEGSIQGVFLHKDWNFLFANQALAGMLGYESPEDLLALENTGQMFAPEEHERLRDYETACQKGEYAPEIHEITGVRKDGSQIWLELRAMPVEWCGRSAIQCVAIDITERKRAKEALQRQKAEVEQILANVPQAIITIDGKGAIRTFNPAAEATFGYAAEKIIGRNVSLLMPQSQGKHHDGYLRDHHETGQKTFIHNSPRQVVGLHKEGREFPMELAIGQVSQDKKNKLFVGVARDITEQLKARKILSQQNERFNMALENMSQGLCMFDHEQRVVVSNERFASMYGLTPEQVKPGTLFRKVLEYRVASNIYAGDTPEEYIKDACEAVAKSVASRQVLELSNGRVVEIAYQPMSDGGWLDTHEDITEYSRIQERIAHLAYHDALTGLANRVQLGEQVQQELKRTRRKETFALLCLDLDNFKDVNDTLGHVAGDQLLKIVSDRLQICVRETDMVARLGGDEFAIVQISKQPLKDAAVLAERVCSAVRVPIQLEQNEIVMGVSVGIVVASKDGHDYETLLKKADMALYQTKQNGRGTYCFFEPAMEASVKDRHALALDLRKALAADQFELYYQPLINLQDNRVGGFEALLRWHHPERGMVSPIDFIPIAEDTGLIAQIGEWVLHQACATAVNWPDDIKVAVNISPVQIRRSKLLRVVKEALATSGLPASRLEIEITESVMIEDKDATVKLLHQLHALGLQISMDDFGTGYSSLSYLQSFPFDKIKIDSSFVKNLTEGNDGIGIVQAVVGIASKLGVTTTAEGVETCEQLNIVRKEGCTQAQGYFLARPMPASEISLMFLRQLTKRIEIAA